MAEEQDEQQQQHLVDAELVLINEQVMIATSNFRIALEKTQPYLIYKFWYKIAYDLTAKAFFFTMGDKVFEVNADLLRNALSITPKDLDHPFTLPAPEKEIIKFINQLGCSKTIRTISALRGMVTCSNIDFVDLIWEEFKYQIESRKNDQISKRPLYFHHVIKLDSTLGNLKFENKGSKEPIFGMAILGVMLNDDIKASTEYSEYLAKYRGVAPVKTRGKDYSPRIDDDEVDSKETKEDEEPLVKTRPSRIVIGGEAHRESKEERVDHSKELKGLETLIWYNSEVPDEIVFKSSYNGVGVTPEVPDKPSDYSSSSSSDSEFGVEEISSDEAEVTKKANNAKIVDAKKDTKDQVAEEQGAEKQPGNEELGVNQKDNEPAGDAQADVHMTEAQPEKPKATLISSHQTLSFAEFTSQFLNDNPKITVNDVLQDPVEP
ncbi:hypothetical protein Tco_0470881 [Tanacetum coccineum]